MVGSTAPSLSRAARRAASMAVASSGLTRTARPPPAYRRLPAFKHSCACCEDMHRGAQCVPALQRNRHHEPPLVTVPLPLVPVLGAAVAAGVLVVDWLEAGEGGGAE